MPSRLKTLLNSGQPAIGCWIGFADPYSVEIMADLGFDWLLIDTEHFPIGRESLRTILIAMRGSASTPIVRLPSNSLDHFQTALDLGAQGVVVPMVSSRSGAEQAVSFCRYPPRGVRGLAPTRASRYFQDLDQYVSQANSELTLVVQIETPEAVANIDEILDTGGLDGIFIGPSDLASFMGLETRTNHPAAVRVVDGLIDRARAHSVPFGLPVWSQAECLQYIRRGGQLLTIGSDLRYLLESARVDLAGMRKLLLNSRSKGQKYVKIRAQNAIRSLARRRDAAPPAADVP